MESLKTKRTRSSTYSNYFKIMNLFNKFLVRLDSLPSSWEERTSLYCTFMVQEGVQSSTIRSYISAIKGLLKDDDYDWDDNLVKLGVLTRACKQVNDVIHTRLPIHCKLLELMCFEIDRLYGATQPYLNILYKLVFLIGYYGLFRIGELVMGDHTIKAKNVHVVAISVKMSR